MSAEISCLPKETTHAMKTSVVITLIRGSIRWTNVSCLEIASMVPMSKKVDSMLGMLLFSKNPVLLVRSDAVGSAPGIMTKIQMIQMIGDRGSCLILFLSLGH